MTPLRQWLFKSELHPKDVQKDMLLLLAEMTAMEIIESGDQYDQIEHSIKTKNGTATIDIKVSKEFIDTIRLRILPLDTNTYPEQ